MTEFAQTYYCDGITITPASGQVEVSGTIIRLGPINMSVLCVLLQNAGQVVSRAELFEQVWPNHSISDDVLTSCISDLRKEIGKHHHSKLIETIPKRGYSWQLPVSDTPSSTRVSTPIRQWKSYLGWSTTVLGMVVLLYTVPPQLLSKWQQPDLIPIAALPIQVSSSQEQLLALQLEQILKQQLREFSNIRFVAITAIAEGQNKTFNHLSQVFGTRWILEGQIRSLEQRYWVQLNLVDARTALIEYSIQEEVGDSPIELQTLCEKITMQITPLIGAIR